MKINYRLGGIIAIIAGVIGIIGHFMIFTNWYEAAMAAESAEPGCEILLKYIMPALADFGLLGSVLFLVSAYGFFTTSGWAFPMSVVGIVLALQGSWFINVPLMAADLPPIYFPLFFPYVLIYFLLMILVGNLTWKRTLLGLVTGLAYVFTLMNGVASMSRILTIGAPLFTLVQRLHWISMIGFGVVTCGILIRPKEWMRILGLTAGVTELVVGIPLAIATAVQLGRFSLFALGPIFSLALVIVFLLPSFWQKLIQDKAA
jgi:hypothetical protein